MMKIKLGFGARDQVDEVGPLDDPMVDAYDGSMTNERLVVVEVDLPDQLAGSILRGRPGDDIFTVAGRVEPYLSEEACDKLDGDFWEEEQP